MVILSPAGVESNRLQNAASPLESQPPGCSADGDEEVVVAARPQAHFVLDCAR